MLKSTCWMMEASTWFTLIGFLDLLLLGSGKTIFSTLELAGYALKRFESVLLLMVAGGGAGLEMKTQVEAVGLTWLGSQVATHVFLVVNLAVGFSGDGSRAALTGALLLVSSILMARP